jgi:hypothetical protein
MNVDLLGASMRALSDETRVRARSMSYIDLLSGRTRRCHGKAPQPASRTKSGGFLRGRAWRGFCRSRAVLVTTKRSKRDHWRASRRPIKEVAKSAALLRAPPAVTS